MNKEIEPKRFATAMNRASILEAQAMRHGVKVTKLISNLESWKKPLRAKPQRSK